MLKVNNKDTRTTLFENFTGPQEAVFNGRPRKSASSVRTFLNPFFQLKSTAFMMRRNVINVYI